MSVDPLTILLSQIESSIATFVRRSSKNQESSLNYIVQLTAQAGREGELHSLRCLLPHISESNPTSSAQVKETPASVLFNHLFTSCSSVKAFLCHFCEAFDQPLQPLKNTSVTSLLRSCCVPPAQEIVLSLALLQSTSAQTRDQADKHVTEALPLLLAAYTDSDTHKDTGLQDCIDVVHYILSSVKEHPTEFGLRGSNELKQFISALKRDFPSESIPVVLLPWLGDTDSSQDILDFDDHSVTMAQTLPTLPVSVADQLQELGYDVTATFDICRQHLTTLGCNDPMVLTSAEMARILIMMMRTQTGLPRGTAFAQLSTAETAQSSWQISVFVQAAKELQPSLDWSEVITNLDQETFLVRDRDNLVLLITALQLGVGANTTFPVQLFYREWERNKPGQLSLILQILANPDVFCFGDHHCQQVQCEVLKTMPDETSKQLSNWKSLDLVELLLNLSDISGLADEVSQVFKWPVQTCPDVLTLALMQLKPPINTLRRDLLAVLIPIFLNAHPNSLAVLNYVWTSQILPQHTMRTVICNSMVAWYLQAPDDHSRLSRILEVAHDLKPQGLYMLLARPNQFGFVIDLACLASRRDFLKLDKWLSDKIREHGENFVKACCMFLRMRAANTLGLTSAYNMPTAPATQIHADTARNMLACLQQASPHVPAFANEIAQLVHAANQTLGKTTPTLAQPTAERRTPVSFDILKPRPQFPGQPGAALDSFGHHAIGDSAGGGLLSSALAVGNNPQLMQQQQQQPRMTLNNVAAGNSAFGNVSSNTQVRLAGSTTSSSTEVDVTQNFTEDVQEQANHYFQQIYQKSPNQQLSVPDFVAKLKQFKNGNEYDQMVFKCMVKNLFEEFRFFREYPPRELIITAEVFGGMIRERIITSAMWSTALHYVLKSYQNDAQDKMFLFASKSLEEFKTILKDYAKYSEQLKNSSNFSNLSTELQEYISAACNGQWPACHNAAAEQQQQQRVGAATQPTATSRTTPAADTTGGAAGQFAVPSTGAAGAAGNQRAGRGGPSLQTTNINILVDATEKEDTQVTEPSDKAQDKIAFMFNNLSQMNLAKKTAELRKLVLEEDKEEYLPWLAQYLVMKRVSIEPNFHPLYGNFVTEFSYDKFEAIVVEETYRNVKILLRSDKRQAASNFGDRQLLKNLGHWLGMITLAKDKPILCDELDIKSLILEAYYKGQHELLYVVPFIAKILESCPKSKAFQPTGAYVQGILSILSELHREPDLKLNLKFEIEVLFKTMDIDFDEFTKTMETEVSILKDTERLASLRQQLSDLATLKQPPDMHANVGASPLTVAAGGQTLGARAGTREQSADAGGRASGSPPPPQFAYHDISVTSMAGLGPHIRYNQNLALFTTMNPMLKSLVRPAVEHAVQELIQPVTDRAIKVAMTTTEHVIKKDMAGEADETKVRAAAHHMMRSLTAGMAMITCHEPLLITLDAYLKQAFYSSVRGSNDQQTTKMIEEAARSLAEENVELAQSFIVKSACEKGIPIIDKKLDAEYQARGRAVREHVEFVSPEAQRRLELLPEALREKIKSSQAHAVYEQFSSSISGFKPTSPEDMNELGYASASTPQTMFKPPTSTMPSTAAAATGQLPAQIQSAAQQPQTAAGAHGEIEVAYRETINEIDQLLHQGSPSQSTKDTLMRYMEALREASQMPREQSQQAALNLVSKFVELFLHGYNSRMNDGDWMSHIRNVFILGCKLVATWFGAKWLQTAVTKALIDCRQDYRYNLDAIDVLIRTHLINMQTYDLHLASSMENGLNFAAASFAHRVIRLYLVDDRSANITDNDLKFTLETFNRSYQGVMGNREEGSSAGGGANILDMIRSEAAHKAATVGGHAGAADVAGHPGAVTGRAQQAQRMGMLGTTQIGEGDPPDLQDKVELILREWLTLIYTPNAQRDPGLALGRIVSTMHVQGVLRTDDIVNRFFRLCVEMCVEMCYRVLHNEVKAGRQPGAQSRQQCFFTLDGFVKLASLMVKHSDNNNLETKIDLLNKVLHILVTVLLQDHQVRSVDFHQLPYHRILIQMFWELTTPDPTLDQIAPNILESFTKALFEVQPRRAPGFAYAWLEIVGHRTFMARMLATGTAQHNNKTWSLYTQLIMCHIKFLAPFLRNIDLPKPIALMYKGTLRVLLVLLHDFPELLCDYHYVLCEAIPPNCVQLRNLVLSAYPRNMRLPDPFMPNLRVDQLPEINQQPKITMNLTQIIPMEFKNEIDSYLRNRTNVSFLSELRGKLQSATPSQQGSKYNMALINAVVLYVGMRAIDTIHEKNQRANMSTIAHTPFMDIFQNLAVSLDTEGRYLFFNAIANQLRYPNSHTHYFSCTLLYLFLEAHSEVIQEQITRILFERLVALRPHPWGLLITFIELIKNSQYGFWKHEFTRCAPEIERLFQSVAISCMGKPGGANETQQQAASASTPQA